MLKLNRFEENKHFIIKDTGYKTPCYIWIMALNNKGYAQSIAYYGPTCKLSIHVHKFLYELRHGKVPKDRILDHLCNMRACIREDHLEPVTYGENAHRGFLRGTKNRIFGRNVRSQS